MGVIVLDGRRGSGDLYAVLNASTGGQTTLGQIEAGDVMSDGWGPAGPILWGAEVKTMSDALGSLQDGRLPASQLPRMHEFYDYVFLLIEADMRVDASTGNLQKRMRKQARSGKWSEYWVDVLYGARERVQAIHFFEWLLSLHLTGGARLLFSNSREMTSAWIVALWKCLGKPWDRHKSLKVFDESHPPRFVIPSRAAKVAKDLADGVGWEKAMAAGEHFGSPQALINATEAEWKGVPGIDKVLAARLFAGARETHRHTVKRGASFGGIDHGKTSRAHSNVQPATSHRVSTKRRANRGTVSRSKSKPTLHHNRGRR
jgi:ERCC4-type nuclease